MAKDQKRILVLGCGFLASNLIVRFLEDRNYLIRIYSRNVPGYDLLKRIKNEKRVEYIRGDFGDIMKISKALEEVDYVYHFIGTTIPQSSNADPVYDIQSNLIATVDLLKECVNHGVKKVVFPSSGGTVYGISSTIPIPETHPTFPLSSYGIVKLAIEKYLYMFKHLYNLDYCVLRVSNPYGKGQSPSGSVGAITIFLGKVARSEPINIWGNGTVTRDFIYIDDVIEAFYKAAGDFKNETGHPNIFNIGSGSESSLNDILGIIEETVGSKVEVNYLSSRSFDVPRNVLDISRARQVLDWEPRTDLREGIKKTWEWMLGKSR